MNFGTELLQMARLDYFQRMKEWSLWALWCLLLIGAFLWLWLGTVNYWIEHGFVPGAVPDWLQALGGVAAPVAVVVLAFWEYSRAIRTAREHERAANYKKARRLRVFIEHVRAYIKHANDNRTRPSEEGYHRHQMQAFQGMFNSLLLDEDDLSRLGWLQELSHHLFDVERCFIPGRFERTNVDHQLAVIAQRLSLTVY